MYLYSPSPAGYTCMTLLFNVYRFTMLTTELILILHQEKASQ